ncbi:MAG: DNA repair protein RecN [Syntrophobacteraceae bacterium]
MLKELVVHNIAIIKHLEISFQGGLSVVSGETGAGKSILVGAVNLILGSRASQELIRTGAGEATVEAVFSLSRASSLREQLSSWDLECDDELLIRRSISRNGRNRIFINDQQISLQQLQQLAKGLISISGQHEHQMLLESDIHLELLDAFGDLETDCREVSFLYSEWSGTLEKLNKLRRSQKDLAERLDLMRFQLQELESAKLKAGEDEALEEEMNLLRHAATLRDAAESGLQILYTGRGSILEQIAVVEKNVDTLSHIDPSQKPLLAHLEQVRIHTQELSHSLQQYAHRVSFDPGRLAAVEERSAFLQRLGKKYGGNADAMISRMNELRQLSAGEEDAVFQERELEKSLSALRTSYLEKARGLSLRRRDAAKRLSAQVEKTLAALDMPKARFAVNFGGTKENSDGEDPPFTASGIDTVEFLLSANPGEDLKPLARVASGGELSRILLALKSLLSRKGEVETLIFDEVDTGIGGRTAELVGLQLKRLAERNQVICITHLPQIACYGDCHYMVAKETVEQETFTNIRVVSSEERVEELSRMLGGISISDKARAHARELLQKAVMAGETGGHGGE